MNSYRPENVNNKNSNKTADGGQRPVEIRKMLISPKWMKIFHIRTKNMQHGHAEFGRKCLRDQKRNSRVNA